MFQIVCKELTVQFRRRSNTPPTYIKGIINIIFTLIVLNVQETGKLVRAVTSKIRWIVVSIFFIISSIQGITFFCRLNK